MITYLHKGLAIFKSLRELVDRSDTLMSSFQPLGRAQWMSVKMAVPMETPFYKKDKNNGKVCTIW